MIHVENALSILGAEPYHGSAELHAMRAIALRSRGRLPEAIESYGIAAACARDWVRAEEHHRVAIHQVDSSPYRVSQRGARYWYAEMLLARGMPGDQE